MRPGLSQSLQLATVSLRGSATPLESSYRVRRCTITSMLPLRSDVPPCALSTRTESSAALSSCEAVARHGWQVHERRPFKQRLPSWAQGFKDKMNNEGEARALFECRPPGCHLIILMDSIHLLVICHLAQDSSRAGCPKQRYKIIDK